MLDSPPMTPKDKCLNNDMPAREKNENNNENEVIKLKNEAVDENGDEAINAQLEEEDGVDQVINNNHNEQLSRQNDDTFNDVTSGPVEASEDEDAETAELSRLRCTSVRTEVIADREKQKQQRKNRCADYPGLAFGSAAFGSETMMKFNIIKNELHNIMRSQLKRVDGEVAALSQRIKALDENLAKSEQYIKTATAALADAVAMEVERRKNAGEDDIEDINANDPLSQFDAQMTILESKLLEAKYLAAKANNTPTSTCTTSATSAGPPPSLPSAAPPSHQVDEVVPTAETEIKKPVTLRRPFPTK